MKQLASWVSALLAGVIIALVVASAAVVVLIFTTPDPGVRREALWGGVFFESREAADGTLSMGVGMSNWIPLVILALVISLIIRLTIASFGMLRRRKAQLEAQQRSAIESAAPDAGSYGLT